MKKMFFLALILALMTAAANAQQISPNRQLTRNEVRHLRMDQRRLRDAKRIAKSDGVITTAEKRRLAMIRKDERRDLKRYRRRRLAA